MDILGISRVQGRPDNVKMMMMVMTHITITVAVISYLLFTTFNIVVGVIRHYYFYVLVITAASVIA